MSVASTQASSCALERRIGEQLVQRAAQPGQSARHRAVDPLGRHLAARAEVDQPHALAVRGLGEGVRERGARVADPLGDGLAAVQMAERDVVHSVEHLGGHGGDPARGDVALAVARRAAGDEGVGEDDGTGAGRPAREVGTDPVHGRAEHRGVVGPPGRRTRPAPAPVRGRAARTPRRRRARRTAAPAWRSRPASVRRCIPAADISRAPTPSRRAESWLPEIITVGTPSRASRCSTSSKSSTAGSGGTARS